MIAEDALRPWEPIELAQEADFSLGAARVRPSLIEVIYGGRSVRLQPRVMQVLVALHQAGGEVVSRDELIARCWGGLTVGEDSITRCMAALRRLADTDARGAFAVETIPRVGYRLTITLGAEDQDDRAANETNGDPTGRPRRSRSLAIGVAAGVSLLAAGAAWLFIVRGPSADFALAPFAAGADPDAKSVSAALPNLMAGLFAKAGVKTLALPSKLTDESEARQAASGAAPFLVRGAVEGDGPMLSATAVITDPRHDEVLWSADVSRPRAEIRLLERQIATRVASVSSCALELLRHAPQRADAALSKVMLSACDSNLSNGVWMSNPDRIRVPLTDIVDRYPHFAPGLYLLAEVDGSLAKDQPPDLAATTREDGRRLAERALKADPGFGRTWLALQDLQPQIAPVQSSYDLISRGLAVSPDDGELVIAMADIMQAAGYSADAVDYAKRAAALSPLDPQVTPTFVLAMAQAGDIGAARAVVQGGLDTWPDDALLLIGRVAMEAREGDPDRALALVAKPTGRGLTYFDPTFAERMRRIALARKAGTSEATAAAANATLADFKAGKLNKAETFLDLATLGAVDQAYAFAKTLKPDEIDTSAFFRPPMAALRADPRFMPLAARVGLVAFWRVRGRWPDFCQAPDAPYDCAKAAAAL